MSTDDRPAGVPCRHLLVVFSDGARQPLLFPDGTNAPTLLKMYIPEGLRADDRAGVVEMVPGADADEIDLAQVVWIPDPTFGTPKTDRH